MFVPRFMAGEIRAADIETDGFQPAMAMDPHFHPDPLARTGARDTGFTAMRA